MGNELAPRRSDFTLKGGLDPREHIKRIQGLTEPESDGLADEAAKAEAERRRLAAGTTARIDEIFGSPERQLQYDDFINAIREKAVEGINRQKRVTDLNRTFDVARRGLTGGSRDVDTQRAAAEQNQEALLGAEDKAQTAGNDLKARDASSRESLVGLANNGLDATSAAARSIQNLQQNTQQAQTATREQGIGDFLAAGAGAYGDQQQAKAYRQGRQSIYSGT